MEKEGDTSSKQKGLKLLLENICGDGIGIIEAHPSIELYERPLSKEVILQCFEQSFHGQSKKIENFDVAHYIALVSAEWREIIFAEYQTETRTFP